MKVEYIGSKVPQVKMTEALYKSWADSHYSPNGHLKYTFDYEDVLLTEPALKKKIAENFEFTIESDLVVNRLVNWRITMRPFDEYTEPEEDINNMLLLGSIQFFNYNIWNLIPFDISEEKVAEYKATKDFEDTGEDHKQIDKLLLALRYNLVLNYSLTNEWAEQIVTYPKKWESREGLQEEVDSDDFVKAYSRFTSQLSRIPNDLYTSTGRGRKGGTLTDKATNLLYEYLVWTEQKVSKADLEQFMLYTSTTIGEDNV